MSDNHTQSILERTDKYNGVARIPDVIANCQSQREIVDELSKLSPDSQEHSVDSFTNAGLLCDEAFENVQILETSIFLALRARLNTEYLILSCGDTVTKTRRTTIPGSFSSLSRRDIASFLAKELVHDERAVGFTLGFKFARNQTQPSGYEVTIHQTNDPDVTREDLQRLGKKQVASQIEALMASLERDEDGNYNVGYSELEARKEAIRESVRAWNPKYVAQFQR